MDLLFASISKSTIPENIDLQDPNIIKNTDAKSVLSLNGINFTNESNSSYIQQSLSENKIVLFFLSLSLSLFYERLSSH
jgi:hypothetical protein